MSHPVQKQSLSLRMTHRGQGQWFMPSLTFRNSAALLFHSHPTLLNRQWLCHSWLSRERVEACFISCQKVVPKKKGDSHVATNNLLLSKGEQSAKRLACVSSAWHGLAHLGSDALTRDSCFPEYQSLSVIFPLLGPVSQVLSATLDAFSESLRRPFKSACVSNLLTIDTLNNNSLSFIILLLLETLI